MDFCLTTGGIMRMRCTYGQRNTEDRDNGKESPLSMTLQQLRDFLAVVEHGGFRAASRAINVSQGGLTKSVAKLEDDHSVTLVERGPKGLVLTKDGRIFLDLARATILEAERANGWLLKTGARQRPSVSIGVSVDPAIRLAPTVLADFRNYNPSVALHITQSVTSELLPQLRDNRLEIALIRLPAPPFLDDLEVCPLYGAQPAIFGRNGHPMIGAKEVSDLTSCDWVIVGGAPAEGEEDASLVELFDEPQLGRPRIAAYSSSLFDAISMMLQSDLLARLPNVVMQHPLVQDHLVEIRVSDPPRPYTVGLVHKKARRLSREAQALSAMIASYVRVTRLRTA